MKKKLLFLTVAISITALMSFTQTDFQKTLIGKWELQTIESPGKPPMPTKELLGDMFLEFKSDFTYIESDGSGDSRKGIWKITDGVYLQMKRDNQTAFQEKDKLKELSPDKIEFTHPDKKKFVFSRVK